MEHKPIVTYAGDVQVFQSVLPSLQKGVGSEAVEWKRAYGRTTKLVHLHPKFIPFDPESGSSNGEHAPDQPLTSLLDQSMLHTFWTDCPDVEVYRSTTKDLIQSWLNSIRGCNVREWLIVVVETPDNKKTKQLLPRTSVLDRIKNDFAQKQTERCICLADPTKIDSKSTESLHAVLHRLRQLLLASYSKTLTKFEENMRAQREKRTEVGWNFCYYFLLQEELAFVLEMLEVYDEALVQYDELDALFTQFVLNSHLTDTPKWLLSFQRYGDRWPALNLTPASAAVILTHIRDTIKNSTVSLLNFRNYLFARQAALLVKQSRITELAQRSLGFLHNCINELNILDVTFSEEGAISCWVFVSCLEILATICGSPQQIQNEPNGTDNKKFKNEHQNVHHSTMHATDFSVHTASLWDYAREKLYDLGKLGGLLPKSQPKSDHLHKVISLAAGLSCVDLPLEACSVTVNGKTESQLLHQPEPIAETPISKLKNALSSKEQFEQHYLELCELAMGTYKHIGRIRSARKVGLSLALYYMEAEEYVKAIGFLTDALKTFRDDKWNLLVVDVLLKLAQCYQITDDHEKYTRTCAHLACCKSLNEERRNHFFDEMNNSLSSSKSSNIPMLSAMDDTFSVTSIQIDTPGKINLDSCPVTINVELHSNLPKPVKSSQLQVAVLLCDNDHERHSESAVANGTANNNKARGGTPGPGNSGKGGGLVKRSSFESKASGGANKEKLTRKESLTLNPSTCEEEDMNVALLDMNYSMLHLDLSQHLDVKQDKVIHGGRLLCHNSHQALRRKDSQMKKGDIQVVKTDFSLAAKTNDIIINPGKNIITLNAQVTQPGMYRLAQVSVEMKQFELVSPRMGCRYKFLVEKMPGKIEITGENLNLIAGIEQVITLKLFTGSNNIVENMYLHVRSSLGLLLKIHKDSMLSTEAALPIPPTGPFSTVTVNVIIKAELGPQKDNAVIEHKLITRSPWSSDETKLPVVFIPPFMSSHRLNTVGRRKFIQIMLHGLCDSNFSLRSHQLTVQNQNSQDIPLVPLNPRSQQLVLCQAQTASYMWEVGVEEFDDEENPLRLEFSVTFQLESAGIRGGEEDFKDTAYLELYRYYICLQRFKTQFEIKSRVEPHKGSEFCRVGNMCSMLIDVEKFKDSPHQSLMYEVRADQHMWAICGRTSGVVSMDGCDSQQMTIDVMPMSPGFLPLPTVHLSKYIPADQKSGNSSVPKLEPFNSGQVFNRSRGAQMHVLPPPQPPNSAQSIGGISNSSLGVSPSPLVPAEHY